MHYQFLSCFHLIIHSISHCIGVSSYMLYIYLFLSSPAIDILHLEPGGVRSFYTILHFMDFLQSVFCPCDSYIIIYYFTVGCACYNLFI